MKKVLLSAVLVVLIAGAGYLIYRYSGSQNQQTSSSSVSSQPSSSQAAVSSEAAASSEVPSQVSSSSQQASSSAGTAKQESINKIKSAINLDWKKYTVKSSSAAKTIKDKTYSAFDIWDDDYQVGPKVLIGQSDGKIYTWTASDTAPILASEDKAFDKTVHTIIGTVEDGAMMNVVLKTADGSELVVRRLGIDTTGLTSMKEGDKIKVTYTGVIKGSDTSRAFITKLETVK